MSAGDEEVFSISIFRSGGVWRIWRADTRRPGVRAVDSRAIETVNRPTGIKVQLQGAITNGASEGTRQTGGQGVL